MDRRGSTREHAARRVDVVREISAAILAAIVAVAAYGWLTPATIRTGPVAGVTFAETTNAWLVTLPILLVFLTAFSLVTVLWIAVIERRRPWPFSPRGPLGNPFWRESIVGVFAIWSVTSAANDWWKATRLFELDDGRFVWVASPAGFAAQYVAGAAALGFGFVLTSLVLGGTPPRGHTASSDAPLEH